MPDSIPVAYLKELTDTLAAEPLMVAFFANLTGYDPLTATTYQVLVGTATEIWTTGTNYTTGGYYLTGLTSSNLAPNGAKVTASAIVLPQVTFTFRYSVIYNSTTGKIRFIKDHLADQKITNGTITITWDNISGIINFSF